MSTGKALGIRVLAVDYRTGFQWHYANLAAPYWRFYWNIRGESRVLIQEGRQVMYRNLEVAKGYLIPPETQFSSESTGSIDHFYIHFSMGHWFTVGRKGLLPVGSSDILQAMVDGIINAGHFMHEKADDESGPFPGYDKMILSASAIALYCLGSLPEGETETTLDDPAIQHIVDLVGRDPGRRFTSEELAQSAGCSERSLRRKFQSELGMTPLDYSVGRRIEQACIALLFGDMSIEEIAADTGFFDRYHFSRVFKKYRGMGPAEYRRVGEKPL